MTEPTNDTALALTALTLQASGATLGSPLGTVPVTAEVVSALYSRFHRQVITAGAPAFSTAEARESMPSLKEFGRAAASST